MNSADGAGLDGAVADGLDWLEGEEVVLSSVFLSRGVRGGVGRAVEEEEDGEASLTVLLMDGFLS